jgi:hypothetical protein
MFWELTDNHNLIILTHKSYFFAGSLDEKMKITFLHAELKDYILGQIRE